MESTKPSYEEAVQAIAEYIYKYTNQENAPTLIEWFSNDKHFITRLINDTANMYDKDPSEFDQDVCEKLDELGF